MIINSDILHLELWDHKKSMTTRRADAAEAWSEWDRSQLLGTRYFSESNPVLSIHIPR